MRTLKSPVETPCGEGQRPPTNRQPSAQHTPERALWKETPSPRLPGLAPNGLNAKASLQRSKYISGVKREPGRQGQQTRSTRPPCAVHVSVHPAAHAQPHVYDPRAHLRWNPGERRKQPGQRSDGVRKAWRAVPGGGHLLGALLLGAAAGVGVTLQTFLISTGPCSVSRMFNCSSAGEPSRRNSRKNVEIFP